MLKPRGMSIKHLQAEMKKELGKLTPNKAKSECFSPNYSRMRLDTGQEQPQRISFKSTSSQKLNTSATLSNKSPILIRQNSLQTALKKHESSGKDTYKSKLMPFQKLKKKKSKKEQTFIKLKRGHTFQEGLNQKVESQSSLQLKFNTPKTKDQTPKAQKYQQMIERYKAKIEQLQEIIESMMQC